MAAIMAIPHVSDDKTGFIVWEEHFDRKRWNYDGYYGRITNMDVSDLQIVDVATFLNSAPADEYDNDNTMPYIRFLVHRGEGVVRMQYTDGTPPLYYEPGLYYFGDSNYSVASILTDHYGDSLFEMLNGAVYRYTVGDTFFWLFDGPDCGGYDIETKLIIEPIATSKFKDVV